MRGCTRTGLRRLLPVEAMAAAATMLALSPAAYAGVCSNQAARSGPSAGLPDCRAFEMVSPANGEDGEVYIPYAGQFEPTAIFTRLPSQSSPDGNSVVYAGEPSAGGNGSIGYGLGNQYLARRSPTGGWTTTNIQPSGYKTSTYQAFSSDLSDAILDSEDAKPLPESGGPEGQFSIPYLRDDGTGQSRALVTAPPPARSPDTAASTENRFGTGNPGEPPLQTMFAGANAGTGAVPPFQDVLFEANDALVEGALETGPNANNLYEWHGGALQQVNLLPAGSGEPPNAAAVFGAVRPRSNEFPNFSHVISADGSKVFWTDLENGRVYVRLNGTITAQVSEGEAAYWTSTPDGRYAYYIESEQLWRYDVETAEREAIVGGKSEVMGVVAVNEAGEDGSYVYFVADAQLTPGAIAHAPNLYLRHAGVTALVATLSPNDDNNGAGGNEIRSGDWIVGIATRTAEATPDGRDLVFMSRESLTGYANAGLSEVYLFEAESSRLTCVSCNPNGAAPPVGEADGNAAVLPVDHNPTFLPPWITDNGGRVVFDTVEPLVAADTNGRQDVYEWERSGEGSCQIAGGCIYLLSGGSSTDVSALVGLSASGNDVFIATRAQLSPTDKNEYFDLYDARVEGVAPTGAEGCPSAGCERQPPPATEHFEIPPTATLSGIGEPVLGPAGPVPSVKPLSKAQKLAKALKACRTKGNKRKRLSCERAARKSYAPAKAKKTSATGRKS